MTARNTLSSQSAAYDALSLAPGSEGNSSQPAISLPPNSCVAQAASSDSLPVFSPTSPSFLATVANAVQQVLSAQQMVSLPVSSSSMGVAFSGGVRQHTQASLPPKLRRLLHLALVSQLLHRPWRPPWPQVGQIILLSQFLCRCFPPQSHRSLSRLLLPRSMQPFLRALQVLLLWRSFLCCISYSW